MHRRSVSHVRLYGSTFLTILSGNLTVFLYEPSYALVKVLPARVATIDVFALT